MNDWPQWFTDPVTTPPPTTPNYRLELVRRRLGEIGDLLADIERAANSAPDGEIVRTALSSSARIRCELVEAERNLGAGPESSHEKST
jgi:hypothetical protein